MNKVINTLLKVGISLFFMLLSLNLPAQRNLKAKHFKDINVLNVLSNSKNYIIDFYSASEKNIAYKPPISSFRDTAINLYSKSTMLYINTKKNVTINVNDNDIEIIKIFLSKVDTLRIIGCLNEKISIFNANSMSDDLRQVNMIEINGALIDRADFRNLRLGSLSFSNCNLFFLNLKDATVLNTFSLKEVRLDSANFNRTLLPSLIRLDTVDLSHVNSTIDLSRLRHISKNSHVFDLERTIRISDTDLDKLKLSYDRLNFHIDTLQKFQIRSWIYEKLLKNLKNEHLTSKYNYYNNQLSDANDAVNHTQLRNFLNEVWWDNGHNRRKVIYNSFFLFGFFFILNCLAYNQLKVVYMPEPFIDYYDRIKSKYQDDPLKRNTVLHLASYVYGSLAYTSFVFWGLKLDLHSLKLRFNLGFFLLILQYMVGLVCVAYIIGIVVVKS